MSSNWCKEGLKIDFRKRLHSRVSCIVCTTLLDSRPSWDFVHTCGLCIILRSCAGRISLRTAHWESLGTRLMGTATSGLGRYWVQSIKGVYSHLDFFPVLIVAWHASVVIGAWLCSSSTAFRAGEKRWLVTCSDFYLILLRIIHCSSPNLDKR